jgi:hypothetical protein
MSLHGEEAFLDYYDALLPLMQGKLSHIESNGSFTNDYSQVLGEVLNMEHSFYF